jgi:hypothetical protein
VHQYPDYVKRETGYQHGGNYISRGTGLLIEWQEGPFQASPTGPNGSMPEQPVRALIHRINHLQELMPCPQNPKILEHLNAVLGLLDERTRDRNSRGVLGTANP